MFIKIHIDTKMRCILVLLLSVFQCVVTRGAVNYCGARMCGHSNQHTYCKYRAGPSPSCSGYVEAPLSAPEKARVLARLNQRRSVVARGWRHWPPAGDMLKLRWVEELSREAQRWADQCRPPRSPEERDVCRDLYSISVGQCVASIVGEAPGLRPESMVDMWFMQSMLYDGNLTSYIPARIKNYYGDFAQMMWSRTFLVGCGRSRFMAEWRGRLRSVERLVCNFAPRGPVPLRPLWIPADAASLCPPRTYPDTLPGLCTYQNDVEESIKFNDSLTVQDNYLLETVLEIEKNESLDYLGSLDELYLTKIAIATIGTPMPIIPLYYSLQKRDIFKNSEIDQTLSNVGNDSEVEHNTVLIDQVMSKEKLVLRTKSYTKPKVNTIGRPKPYDINELNDAVWDQKSSNLSNQDLMRKKEKDFYAEYGLIETEEDVVLNNTTVGISLQLLDADTTTVDIKSETNGFTNIINTTRDIVGPDYFINSNGELNELFVSNKTVEEYLSDPETVRAIQDALEKMERTLASPGPASTPGKVRRELRNLEADLQKVASTVTREVATATSELRTDDASKDEQRNRSKDRAPMLSMVLKYMPYLKAYESSIVGNAYSSCEAVCRDLYVVTCSIMLHVVL